MEPIGDAVVGGSTTYKEIKIFKIEAEDRFLKNINIFLSDTYIRFDKLTTLEACEGSPLYTSDVTRPPFTIFQLAWELILVRCIVYYRGAIIIPSLLFCPKRS